MRRNFYIASNQINYASFTSKLLFESHLLGIYAFHHEHDWYTCVFGLLIIYVWPIIRLMCLIKTCHSAHWACTGVSGGWSESSLQEFDHNHETKNQVFMQINDVWCSNRAPTSHQRPFYCFKDVNFPQKHPFFTFEAIQTL